MSQNNQIINYLKHFSDSTFPVSKQRERTIFQRNVEMVFGSTSSLMNMGEATVSPPLGSLVFWEDANGTEHCGIAVAKNGFKVYSITQQKGLTQMPQGVRAMEARELLESNLQAIDKMPTVLEWVVKTTGSVSTDNNAPLVQGTSFVLGLHEIPNDGFYAGIEIKVKAKNYSDNYVYDISRKRDSVVYAKVNDAWVVRYPKVKGKDDDSNMNDEDANPHRINDGEFYMYAVDRPGIGYGIYLNGASEVLFISNFYEFFLFQHIETEKVRKDNTVLHWHTKIHLVKQADESWLINTSNSSVGEGHKSLSTN
jgi:hypothetical protein